MPRLKKSVKKLIEQQKKDAAAEVMKPYVYGPRAQRVFIKIKKSRYLSAAKRRAIFGLRVLGFSEASVYRFMNVSRQTVSSCVREGYKLYSHLKNLR